MKYQRQIIATSHVDKHHERLSHGALESLVDQINSQYIPVTIEHDPRNPPIGRIIQAELKKLKDGEIGVEAKIQLLEPGDQVKLDESRTLSVREITSESVHIIYGQSYRNKDDQCIIQDIVKLLDGSSDEFAKKAVEPISVLTIAVAAALGSFFGGFFNQAGADAWQLVKEKVKKLLRSKREQEIEHLLSFQFYTKKDNDQLLVEVILTNPGDDVIDEFFNLGIKRLDQLIPDLVDSDVGLKKMVLDYSTGRFSILYGVRKDAVPLFFKGENASSR